MERLIFNEIGSNFFEEDLKVKVKKELPEDNIIYLDSGRNAIRLILNNIESKTKKALLPAYTCDTVIEPFIEKGYEIEYYDINKKLLIDEKEFKNKVESFKPEIILVHAYFGKDTISNIRKYLKTIKNKTCIIEDITQLLLKEKQDLETAHFLIGSFRKWCTIPDGGFIKNNTTVKIKVDNYRENTQFIQKQLEAFKRKQEYAKTMQQVIKDQYLKLYREAKQMLDDNKTEIFLMSQYTRKILERCDFEYIKERRKKNYQYLANNLTTILGKLEDEEVPLYFPMLVDKKIRKDFQNYMAERKIYCPVIWPKYDKLKIEKYKCNEIYDEIICIPCDQRYDEKDMEKIKKAIKEFYKER